MTLGTLVSPVTFRQAAVLANASATANEISGGRVTLGMGAGWMKPEHEAFGFPFPPTAERLQMLSHQIEAVRGFWGEGTRPALVVGGAAKRGTVDPAARHADEYNTTFATPEECRKRRERVAAACHAHGREPIPFSLMTACAIGRDEAEVRDRIRRRIQRLGIDTMDADDWMAQRGNVAIVGTVEQAAERLRDYDRAGVERVMLQHLDHTDLDMVALIGRKLAPAVTA